MNAASQRDGAAEERALLERLRRGESEAFDEVLRRHRQTVYAVAWRVLGNHGDADEAAQLTFVKAWKAIGGFRGDASLRTWLVRIALNVSRSLIGRRRPEDGLDEVERTSEDDTEGADALLDRIEARSEVRKAVLSLPPRQREVVLLKVFSEMTYGEVAGVMELSEGAVKAHLHQAVSNLRRRLIPAEAQEAL
ncbi:hypothetical protein ABI59_06360 [Acidobacteria bacterium Mor1]|nr:hypothetical protein ABI59_06360 [Acidobacteria bacterium Mor1]